ncbi:hypothetical protein [Flavobacterium soyangense]|uniref:Uncharacterized protein n=1 Tax=Flavobacterium soyangense TaxID=2023265 RepID=A0A930UA72_9FLAO|nr:hypothetical protein [Flavobacterium soyangense]MBF2708367.1 hypothetical protein [Flavobacterium soyangense]
MKHPKTIFKILIVFLFVAQNSFANKPIPGVGIVVKKNPGTGGSIIKTGNNGGFSTQLEEGEYELSFPQDQLQSSINRMIKINYTKSTYQYDGSGIELVLDNPQIRVKLKPKKENIYTINEQNSSFIIIVPAGGATLSGILSWNDDVMKNSISCPNGFVMKNGECVPMVDSASENRGIDKADIRKNTSLKSNPLYESNGVGENPLSETKRKGINEGGLKKNEIENVANDAEVKAIAETMVNRKSVNNINGGMPNRISMNVTVPKQTQGATFGEKLNSGKINVTLVEGGCVVLFPSNVGYRVNTSDKSINELSKNECQVFGEKVNAGLHSAGGALASGASLLGGALPGGAIISAAVSSVGNLAGGGGAAAASYARTGKTVQKIQDDENDVVLELQDGECELVFVIVEKATSGLKDTLKTQVRIGFSVENGVVKPKQYTGHVTLMK